MNRSIGRRELLLKTVGLIRGRPTEEESGSRVAARAALRPPGAVPETEFQRRCTGCGECAAACPYGAIRLLDRQTGDRRGRPAVVPRSQPCRWCEGFPCVAACAEGALRPERVERGLGTARIDAGRCVLATGTWCDECVRECPFSGQAIELTRDLRVRVNPEHCVGCGMCEFVCPVSPPAIWVRSFEL